VFADIYIITQGGSSSVVCGERLGKAHRQILELKYRIVNCRKKIPVLSGALVVTSGKKRPEDEMS